jgi:hypothetical protein
VIRQELLADAQWIAEWESHQRRANKEAGAWRAICDLVNEHNSLIEANKPGIAIDKDGKIVTVKLQMPKGKGAKQKRQAIIERVLLSEKQDMVTRFANALDAILREEKARLRLTGLG